MAFNIVFHSSADVNNIDLEQCNSSIKYYLGCLCQVPGFPSMGYNLSHACPFDPLPAAFIYSPAHQ